MKGPWQSLILMCVSSEQLIDIIGIQYFPKPFFLKLVLCSIPNESTWRTYATLCCMHCNNRNS